MARVWLRSGNTGAALRAICLRSNLVEAFQGVLAAPPQTLATLRVTAFASRAFLGCDGRQPELRLSPATPWQQRFLAQLHRLLTWGPSNPIAVGEASP